MKPEKRKEKRLDSLHGAKGKSNFAPRKGEGQNGARRGSGAASGGIEKTGPGGSKTSF